VRSQFGFPPRRLRPRPRQAEIGEGRLGYGSKLLDVTLVQIPFSNTVPEHLVYEADLKCPTHSTNTQGR
jgi:hypothetical protein